MKNMQELATALAVIGAAAGWWFVVAFHYLTGGDWHRKDNPGGRHVMQMTACLALLLTLTVVARIWPTYPGRPWVTLAAFAWLVGQLVYRCVLMHHEQHDRREVTGRR